MASPELEEFEAGENVTGQVRRNRAGGIVVSVRLTQEDSARLVGLAEDSGKTVSQIARQAIRAFLSQHWERPVFVPEITGSMPNVNIVTFTPLGSRTVKEGAGVVEGEQPTVRTGNYSLAGVTC